MNFKDYFISSFTQSYFGLSILEVIIIFVSFIIALVLKELFAKIIISKIKNFVQKTGNQIDDNFFDCLASPLKSLPIIFVFILIGLFVNSGSNLDLILEKINKTLVTIFIFWFLHQLLVPISQLLKKLEQILSKALVQWLTSSMKYLIIFLGIVAVLETWGIKIGPIIAGLGLFGVAVALGAQDLFKNLISGIMIIFEKRFNLNDIIKVPGQAIGTVEQIGFRSTLIRQFDSTPISIPNYVFSDTSIINFSDRKYRRINWVIGLTYETSVKKLKNICKSIEEAILTNNNFLVNDNYQLQIRVDKFNESSIDLFLNVFVNTNDWAKYLETKEDLVFIIKDIVEKNESSFAFPSHSIYVEKYR